MDTPRMLMGEFYNNHVMVKCPSFKQCSICKLCENYKHHNQMCIACEDRKYPRLTCECKPHTKLNYKKVTDFLKVPFFTQNRPKYQSEYETKVPVAYEDKWEETMQEILDQQTRLTNVHNRGR
jgi:hypothetical protein